MYIQFIFNTGIQHLFCPALTIISNLPAQAMTNLTNKTSGLYCATLMAVLIMFMSVRVSAGSIHSVLPAHRPYKNLPAGKTPTLIPIRFTLKQPGFVTLVIENSAGIRVRNLIADTWFPAGNNTAWWDGLDDTGRDADAARHGVYSIPQHFVEPGQYHIRGLVHPAIEPHYQFTVYNTGTPPWNLPNHTGAWLGNHTAPQSALFVPANRSPTHQPAVYLGCYVTEGLDGLIWVDLNGQKMGGKGWIGGSWTAAPFMARDAGAKADTGIIAYVASAAQTGKQHITELRLTALTQKNDKRITIRPLGIISPTPGVPIDVGGLAAYNNRFAVSITGLNQLMLIDAGNALVSDTISLNDPHGLAFDVQGRLIAISGKQVYRFNDIQNHPKPHLLIGSGLEAPYGITLDASGRIYISDRGNSNQVKVFTADGNFIRTIGNAGPSQAGIYNPLHMNSPAGLTIDDRQQLWVTEQDFLPKRVSIWSLDGKLINAFYGPVKYGGGGMLDSEDKTRFYYAEAQGAMEFKLDWQKGTSQLSNVYYRPGPADLQLPGNAAPQTAFYRNGQRYFTNCYNSSPTSGASIAFLFADRNGIAVPVAAMGNTANWDLLKTDDFKPSWPQGTALNMRGAQAFFIWTDNNNDGQVQPQEVTMQKAVPNGITVMPDLSFCVARLDDKAVRFAPLNFTNQGIPVYNINQGQVIAAGVLQAASSGGSQMLVAPDGHAIITLGIQPYSSLSVSGTYNGAATWSYPDLWPGLHAGHESPAPNAPGQLIATTRLLGPMLANKGSAVGPLWAVNGNLGSVYVFTADGLFVTTLFNDARLGKPWNAPAAIRNMRLDSLSLGQENFWPTISQTSDGIVYLVDGTQCSIIRLDGLNNISPLPAADIQVTKNAIAQCSAYLVSTEAKRQSAQNSSTLTVPILAKPPVVDGRLSDWKGAAWINIDNRGVKAYFNSNSRPYNTMAAVAVTADKLYIAYQNVTAKLQNSGEMPTAFFKTGDALDVMIGSNDKARPDRTLPVAGDMRLIVTTVKNKPVAMLYQAVLPGTKDADRVPFSSPSRTISFDKVEDVTAQIAFAGINGNYEIAVPLKMLGLAPTPGITIKADIGVLRGYNGYTVSRIYWSNKAAGNTADVPSEAALTPNLWGNWSFK